MSDDPNNHGRNADGTLAPGNRIGPPKRPGSKRKATQLVEKIMLDGAEDVINATMSAARAGDMQAAKIILDRIAPPRKGARVPLALPKVESAADVLEALGRVVAAMGEGKVSPEEAAIMAQVIAAPRQVFESHELERRLTAIEEQLARLGLQRGRTAA